MSAEQSSEQIVPAVGPPPAEVTERSDALVHAVRSHRTLWRDALGRLTANKLAMLGSLMILAIVIMAVFAP
ncbi:MAG: hypothetical protein ACREH6_05935, partial [Geminicoccaceae bacterium]